MSFLTPSFDIWGVGKYQKLKSLEIIYLLP